MSKNKMSVGCLAGLLFLAAQISRSQTQPVPDKNWPIDSKTRTAVIESINDLVMKRYVIRDIAPRVKDFLNAELKNGAYDKLDDPRQFAEALWADLSESSGDRHFYIEFNPERATLEMARQSQVDEDAKKANQTLAEKDRLSNFGFKKLEIIKGNVGYLDLEYFSNPEFAGETAVAAMNFLAHADAVIIDLRGTPGGKSGMVQMLSSYFVKSSKRGRTLLSTLEQPYDGSVEQSWTIPYLPGPRMDDRDLYILTDEDTASAAESFAYMMKALQRATIVGKTTRGSAHNVDFEVIQGNFVMHLPVRRPVNPITGTNWEGTGVEPHIAVPGKQALDKAYAMALEKILEKNLNEDQKFQAAWELDALKAKLEPVKLDEKILKKYIGRYGERKITYEKGELYYQRTGPKFKLIPLKEAFFAVEGMDYFRVKMVTDESGNVIELVGLYDDGRRDPSKRTK